MREEFCTGSSKNCDYNIEFCLGNVFLEPILLSCGDSTAESADLCLVVNLSDWCTYCYIVSQVGALGDKCAKYRSISIETLYSGNWCTHSSYIIGCSSIILYYRAHCLNFILESISNSLHALGGIVLWRGLVNRARINLQFRHSEYSTTSLISLNLIAKELIFRFEVNRSHNRICEVTHANLLNKLPVSTVKSVVGSIDVNRSRTLRLTPVGSLRIFVRRTAALVEECYILLRSAGNWDINIAATLHICGIATVNQVRILVGKVNTLNDYLRVLNLLVSISNEAVVGVNIIIKQLVIESRTLFRESLEFHGAVILCLLFNDTVEYGLVGHFAQRPCPLCVSHVATWCCFTVVWPNGIWSGRRTAGVTLRTHCPVVGLDKARTRTRIELESWWITLVGSCSKRLAEATRRTEIEVSLHILNKPCRSIVGSDVEHELDIVGIKLAPIYFFCNIIDIHSLFGSTVIGNFCVVVYNVVVALAYLNQWWCHLLVGGLEVVVGL